MEHHTHHLALHDTAVFDILLLYYLKEDSYTLCFPEIFIELFRIVSLDFFNINFWLTSI